MAVSSEINKNTYSGDGSTTVFSYTFRILNDDHVLVQIKDTNGVITTKTKTTDYSVSGVDQADGGSITFVTAPLSTDTVILLRNIPYTQTLDYKEAGVFPAESHESGLDKLTMINQQQQEEIDRVIKVDAAITGFDATMPDPVADAIIGFNSAADGLAIVSLTDLNSIIISGSTVNGLVTWGGSDTLVVESGAIFDGSDMTLGGDLTLSTGDLDVTAGDVTVTAGEITLTAGNLNMTDGDIIMGDAKGIYDDSNNEQLLFQKTTSAVNYVEITNAATGNNPSITAAGSDSDITLTLDGKGTGGEVRVAADLIVTDDLKVVDEVRMYDNAGEVSGDYVGFQAPPTLASSYIWTLPSTDGTNGQALVTNGTGGLSWSSSGSTVKVSSTTASSSASVEFTGLTSTYRYYYIVLDSVRPATDSANLEVLISDDNGSTYESSGYYQGGFSSQTGGTTNSSANSTAQTTIFNSASNAAGEYVSGTIHILNPDQGRRAMLTAYIGGMDLIPNGKIQMTSSECIASSDFDAIKIEFSSGNIAEGEFTLYGVI